MKKAAAADVPSASDESELLADWLELQTLFAPSRRYSREALVRVLHRNGSTDVLEDPAFAKPSVDKGSVRSQERGDDAFSEIDTRIRACRGRYPFKIENGTLVLDGDPTDYDYVFLLLLSGEKPTAGHAGTAALFEDICVAATLGYLGGPSNGAKAFRFGSPRKSPFAKLHQALDDLCVRLGEGGRCRYPDKAKHTGDDQLDVVAWREFADPPEGKLILFGQCCAGRITTKDVTKWRALGDGGSFVNKWLSEPPCVKPIRAFYVPWRVRRDEWKQRGEDSGIVFDRCRIVSCSEPQAGVVATRRAKTIEEMMKARTAGSA